MSPADLYGPLLEEPFGQRMADVADMTDAQIVGLFGRKRDKEGRPLPADVPAPRWETKTPAAEAKVNFLNLGLALGISIDELEKAWAVKTGKP